MIVRPPVVDRLSRNIEGQDLTRPAGQLGRAVTRSAAGVEHPLSARHPRREGVPRHMLVPQVRIDFARNHTLAGEFSQSDFLKVLV